MSLFSTDFEGSTSVATFFDIGTAGHVGNFLTDPSNFASTDGGAAHIFGRCNSGYCYTGVNQDGYGFSGCFSITTSTELYFRAYMYLDTTLGIARTGDLITFFSSSGGGYISRLNVSSGILSSQRDTGSGSNVTLGTASSIYPTDDWHLLEIHLKCATDGSGIFDVAVDGSTSGAGFTFSGQTNHTSDGCLAVQLQNVSSLKQIVFFDDVAVNTAVEGAPGELACPAPTYIGLWGGA